MNYMQHATDIVAYTFQADTYCPTCIAHMFHEELSERQCGNLPTEDVLNVVAENRGIDRYNESSYDSGDFPKVVFSSQVEDVEHCGNCHEEI